MALMRLKQVGLNSRQAWDSLLFSFILYSSIFVHAHERACMFKCVCVTLYFINMYDCYISKQLKTHKTSTKAGMQTLF